MPDPKLAALIKTLRARPVPEKPDVAWLRQNFEDLVSAFRVADRIVSDPISAGGVPGEWLRPAGADRERAILYLHGGAYVIGSVRTYRDLVWRMARAAAVSALAIDYRLAPEHPFPAAVDDAVAAYRWLIEQVDPSRVVIAGDSAGGGLTLATLVALRDTRVPLPAAAVCLSPWVDLEGLGESMTTKADVDPMILREPLLELAQMYLGGADPRTPLAAPLYADLAGLPPLLVQVGTAEMLLDDATRLAERARAADVDVTLSVYEDMIHVWQLFPLLDDTKRAVAEIGTYVREKTS